MNHTVFIGLGSNMGDRRVNLSEALGRMSEKVSITRASAIYETEPWGFTDQPKFLNQVVKVQTELAPEALLNYLKRIEAEMGRESTFRYGPRCIDLDILFYDDRVIASEKLAIPHPSLHQRAFVLLPLSGIAPDLLHPVLKKTVRELLNEVDISGVTPFPSTRPAGKAMAQWGKRTYIMGILNLTPDSFSGDGLASGSNLAERAVEVARAFVADGVDILDLGAESSRPGSQPVSAEMELARLLPALKVIRTQHPQVFISIDTCKSAVARQCLQEGADWINDIWGLTSDAEMAEVVSEYHAGIVLMHNRSRLGAVSDLGGLGKSYAGADYADFMQDIKAGLENSIALARGAGIADERIILDPGIGFGKSVPQNLALINRLDELKTLGFPLLSGPSRKSFIGQVLNLPVEEREEGTAAAVALSIARGADIVRVHNVKTMARVARMADAIVRGVV